MYKVVQVSHNRWREEYDIADVISRAELPPKPGAGKSSTDASHRPSQDWDLGAGLDGAKSMFRDGWPEGIERVREIRARMDDAISPMLSQRTTYITDVAGPIPNVPALVAGLPDRMLRPEIESQPDRYYLRLYCPYVFHCDITAQAAAARGAAMLALVDVLETHDIRIQINLCGPVYSGGSFFVQVIRVKDYEETLALPDLSFIISHPAFFRRLGFSLMERSDIPASIEATRWNYGMPASIQVSDLGGDDMEATAILPTLRGNELNPLYYFERDIRALPEDIRELITHNRE